ncbi:MAG: nucleoside phosphorylase [Chloroflexi bacterium]|nr:nucleoside phosphorylase [Chloroflexota bacterium]
MTQNAPILEFDEDRSAILLPDPFRIGVGNVVSARGVLCFFKDVLDELLEKQELVLLGTLRSEIGLHPVYDYTFLGKHLTVFHPGVGSPLAAAFLEELIAVGVTKFIVCGGCGVLNQDISVGHPIILTSAVRDEGTSYHYIPPSREVKPHPQAVKALESVFNDAKMDYRMGKTWTTDALYRETPGRRKLRMEEGCDVVEMEAAAFFAVAQFREVVLGQVVYGGDLVIPEGWDGRGWHKRSGDRRLMFEMASRAVLQLK